MGTVKQVDEQLQRTLREARNLLAKIGRKQAELQMLRQSLPLSQEDHRAELTKLQGEATEMIGELRANMKAADLVARKIEGHLLWKEAVRSVWGEDGLQQCYAKMRELEAQRAEEYDRDDLRPR
ncbi:hypothetical protein [Ideonella livida]|uniref:Uncharacterized protein n=1 Tax=Ideonella livida TaxID=2707176 RepID=A0A7C9THL2_9BURK|nr:hypothetical protein [Ideonella livida]NDY89722.1 hypothetical protein [Ideonella livida]